ncbi:3-isopropylmalate dehydratase [Lacrimispora amygdalina]|uniref:LeuD/DmdB family oxidoreductase small subunit n=1 Tax=Lacrimispora amygdalina TaxID=253257 RepID=UPI000BE43D03|nr:3-isopropylmalate dehydratase [Lacrimispora amygdalina]
MKKEITGKVTIVGNNIDTDQIYPGCFLAITDEKEIGSHCLAGVDENIAPNFPKGGVIVAGTNFGCGSSREHAPIALLNMGVSAVVADSFARIFFRNSINLGLPLIVCKGISKRVKDGQTLLIDLENGTVTIKETNEKLCCDKLGDQAMKILEAGGIKPMMRARFGKSE